MEIILCDILKIIAIFAAIFAVNARNPIHSIFSLILVFINAGGLILLFGFDFLGIVFILVYVGAIMVLFLFIIMMLNIKIVELKSDTLNYLPLSALILFLLAFSLASLLFLAYPKLDTESQTLLFRIVFENITLIASLSKGATIHNIGTVLYNFHPLSFILLGIILLIAMMGVILLNADQNGKIRRQVIFEQNSREFSKSIRRL